MAFTWNFWLFFTISKITGYSALEDPVELIGTILLLIPLVIGLYVIFIVYKKYKQTEDINMLLFVISGAFLYLTGIFLFMEKFSFSTLGVAELADIYAIIGVICSAIYITIFNIFSFRMTFPERAKVLSILFTIIAIIYVGSFTFAVIHGPPYSNIENFDYVFSTEIMIIFSISFTVISVVSPAFFLYFGIKVRNEDRPKSSWSLWMGIALTSLSVSGFVETLPFIVSRLSVFSRIFLIIYAIIIYFLWKMPDWFKRKINWPD